VSINIAIHAYLFKSSLSNHLELMSYAEVWVSLVWILVIKLCEQ